MMNSLQIYNMLPETESLGPGKRFAIWTQGCDKNCDGCLSPRSHSLNGGMQYQISEIIEKILEIKNLEGLTVSGGEPFLQAEGLNLLIVELKKKRDYGIIMYSGYNIDELNKKAEVNKNIRKLLGNIDLLIDGTYDKNLDDGKSLRGSSNQNIIALTERYKNNLNLYGKSGRKVEMFFNDDKIYFSGVPGKEFLKEWNRK